MDVVFRHGGRCFDLVVSLPGAATAGDLAGALVPGSSAGLRIDGHVVEAHQHLGDVGLHDGAVLEVATAVAPWPEIDGPPVAELRIVGGPGAGRRVPLHDGTNVVTHLLDRARPAVVEVGVAGPVVLALPSPLEPGDVEVVALPPAPAPAAPSGIGRLPFHRPPRQARARPPAPVAAPDAPVASGARVPVLGLAALGPIVGAGLVVAVTGEVRFALFAALGPLAGAFAAFDQRRRSRGESRAERRRFDRELAAFRDGLAAAGEAERSRRTALAPDPAEVTARAEHLSPRLWERVGPATAGAAGCDDHLVLRVGRGQVTWAPPVSGPARASAEVDQAVTDASVLVDAPVLVQLVDPSDLGDLGDLGDGGVLGIAGPRAVALGVARSLVVQAAVHHGPSDLAVAVCTAGGRAADWDWAKWLPHVHRPDGQGRWLAEGTSAASAVLGALATWLAGSPDTDAMRPTVLLVVDDLCLTAGADRAARALLARGAGRGGQVAGIVVAPTVGDLPACCTTVVEVDGTARGSGSVQHPQRGERTDRVRPDEVDEPTARACARHLARLSDPEVPGASTAMPRVVPLVGLLGLHEVSAAAVVDRWAAAAGRPAVPIGSGSDGPIVVDLDADGPHALVAGTTGSGKSELLRSFVVGLAATVDPHRLTFVLVDFKGGSAFDECARLPHTVGLVTDLDPHLAERALRCLEAELRHRERELRAAGCTDLARYFAAGTPRGPLPRLVVVVDEFATLKQDLPGFVDSLVSVAQRGRSLGVHLVLATQRPAGAVSDDIRANTGLRIALRVQDPAESLDVVGTSAAAGLPRDVPGRALVRRGPGEVVEVQTALSSAPPPAPATHRDPITFAPLRFGPDLPSLAGPGPAGGIQRDPASLRSLVAAIDEAFRAGGGAPPRRPWPDPLPTHLPARTFLGAVAPIGRGALPAAVPYGLLDLPDEQRHAVAAWRPAQGNLLLLGSLGAGTTSTLRALAVSVARHTAPVRCHLYVVDMAGGELGGLGVLAHCGAVIGAGERERQVRLVRLLRGELERRRRGGGDGPAFVVLVDGLGALDASLAEAGPGPSGDLLRVLADGPELGLHVAAAADRPGSVPTAVAALFPSRLAFHLADPTDALVAGMGAGRRVPLPAGRAIDPASGLSVQVARVEPGEVDELAGGAPAPTVGGPAPIGVLPRSVATSEVVGMSAHQAAGWSLVIGRLDGDLGPAVLRARDGEHVLVAGPARSGVSTALGTVARAGLACAAEVVAVAGPRSPLGRLVGGAVTVVAPDAVGEAVERLAAASGPRLLVLDDAHDLADAEGHVAGLLAASPPGLLVVAGGRPDLLRAAYGHWTRDLRRSRLGVLLAPTPELDGELLGVRLPRPELAPVAGRGYLVEAGTPEVVQVAHDVSGPAPDGR